MSRLFSRASSTVSCKLISSLLSWISCSSRGELTRFGSSMRIGLYGAIRFGKGFGARVKLYLAEPRDTGVILSADGLACGAGFCTGSWAKAGETGPTTIIAAVKTANSGRANCFLIMLLTLRILPLGAQLIYMSGLNSNKTFAIGVLFQEADRLAPFRRPKRRAPLVRRSQRN